MIGTVEDRHIVLYVPGKADKPHAKALGHERKMLRSKNPSMSSIALRIKSLCFLP